LTEDQDVLLPVCWSLLLIGQCVVNLNPDLSQWCQYCRFLC